MVPPGDVEAANVGGQDTTVKFERAQSTMDALTKGTANGLALFLNIIALLVVFVALVSLVNQMLGVFPAFADAPLTLERILGWVFAPITWLIGIPWNQAATAGSLMGIKTVLNEFLAFLEMSKLAPDALDERSRLIMTYALCGFANFGSLAIMLGGLTTMVPERRGELVELGLRTIVSGTLATLMTGAVVGILTW
jgi:CNT family concentrative nucleoside transporter